MSAASTVAETFYSRFVVAFTQQLFEIECPLLWHRRALPLCVYATNGLRWPFAAFLAVAGLAWGASHGESSAAARAIQHHFEASKILASRGLCAGVLVAGHIGTSAGAWTNAGHLSATGSVTCTQPPDRQPLSHRHHLQAANAPLERHASAGRQCHPPGAPG